MPMDKEKRTGQKAIPDNYQKMLNSEQLMTLRRIEGFGWRLQFIRRPLFQKVVPILYSPDNQEIGILEEDGRINTKVDIKVRK